MKAESVKSSIMLAGLTRGAWMGEPADRHPERCVVVGGVDPAAGRQRIARQFFVSLLGRYMRNAADVLRQWADELEGQAEEGGGLPRLGGSPVALRRHEHASSPGNAAHFPDCSH